MAGKRVAPIYNPMSMTGGGSSIERHRPRTWRETVNDGLSAAHQVKSLNRVTKESFDSVHDLTDHRDRIAARRPELEASLNALLFNHVQNLLDVQSQVTNSVRREMR